MTPQPSLTEQALNIDWKSFDENAVKFIEQVLKENIELKKRVMGFSRPAPPAERPNTCWKTDAECFNHEDTIRKDERERMAKRFFELEENGIPECKSRKCSANDDPYPCNKCIFEYILAESLRREGAP